MAVALPPYFQLHDFPAVMVLLTSSAVSAILSSGVVCMFTLALFFSGYTLQQQSVRNIQIALKPTAEAAPPPLRVKRDLIDEQGSYIKNTAGNYAYLQLISNPYPSDICSAILFFKTLAVNGTAVTDRLFMYPKEWDDDDKKAKTKRKRTKQETKALILLHEASVQYDIWLLPIDMSHGAAGYRPTDTKLLALGQVQFMQYDSVLYIQTPGLILDTEKLDAVLLDRPLPGKHDKNRRESFNNEAWVPMPLRPHNTDSLPPVYLVTVNNIKSKGRVEARTHVPNPRLRGFADLVVGPEKIKGEGQPGYVYFEHDGYGHVKWKDNPMFESWRAQQYEVCKGLDLDDDSPSLSEQ